MRMCLRGCAGAPNVPRRGLYCGCGTEATSSRFPADPGLTPRVGHSCLPPLPSLRPAPLLARTHTVNPRAGSDTMDREPHEPSAGVVSVPRQPPSEHSRSGPQGPSMGGDSGTTGPRAELEWRALAWSRFGKVNQAVGAFEIL